MKTSYQIFNYLVMQGLTQIIDEKKVKQTGNCYMDKVDFKVYHEYNILENNKKKYFNDIELFSKNFSFFVRQLGDFKRQEFRITDFK